MDSATSRLNFSSEHYIKYVRHYFELNLVIDGERVKFLSAHVPKSFSPIRKLMEPRGFRFEDHRVHLTP